MNRSVNSVDGLSALLERQQQAVVGAGTVSAEVRRERIQQVINMVVAEHKSLVAAMAEDFGGRAESFSLMNDVLGSLGSLKHARDHLEGWLAPQSRTPFAPYDQLGAQAQVMYQPKGSVGIIGTWNAPLFTLLSPLACVLGAGNRAILKPSEITPRTAQAIADAVARHLDPEVVGVVTGGAEVGAVFSAQPFDHLMFTGSTEVGKKIMRAAAENLVPVTLELGGKSPAILSRSADLEESCKRLTLAKGANGGQLCVSPDLLYVPADQLESVIDNLKTLFSGFYPNITDNPDVVPVVNEQHLSRIEGYIEDARIAGARIESSHDDSQVSDVNRRRPLRLVIDPPKQCRIMQEEIFGPALVLLPYDDIADVIQDINSRSNPLALYYFGQDKAELEQVLSQTLSGGVSVNDALIHAAMHEAPFGGVGASGMGHYHGYEGFLEFSHMRTVFTAPEYDPRGEWGMLPPYHDGFQAMMEAQVTAD
ncbi:coniferyl aldehyde dehydrogenase [Amphritea sp. HPY]|uniref:coniferyl aldehyde dehydrogenase n=1 Tax=Amphritea sp. HPY TaxID=3421652 RepID=UPI003D7C92F4